MQVVDIVSSIYFYIWNRRIIESNSTALPSTVYTVSPNIAITILCCLAHLKGAITLDLACCAFGILPSLQAATFYSLRWFDAFPSSQCLFQTSEQPCNHHLTNQGWFARYTSSLWVSQFSNCGLCAVEWTNAPWTWRKPRRENRLYLEITQGSR